MDLILDGIAIFVTVVVFVAASSKKSSSSLYWAMVGVLYYVIARILFTGILFGIAWLFFERGKNDTLIGVFVVGGYVGGIFFALLATYVMGEISGLNIRKIFRDS
jgi:hypothetical protein